MGTRGIIAKVEGDGWKGRYHHWDSYPEGLGKTLHEARDKYFDGNVQALIKKLIDDEPVGWSSINGFDLSKPPQWGEERQREEENGPQSYSARGEKPHTGLDSTGVWITSDGDDGGTEWCYVLSERGITVLERRFGSPENDQGHGVGMFGFGASDTTSGGYWHYCAFVPWDVETDGVPWEEIAVWDDILADRKEEGLV